MYGLISKMKIQNDHSSHGFYNWNGTRDYTWVMPTFSLNFNFFSLTIDAFLGLHDRCDGLESYSKSYRHSIGNSTLNSA